jgi:hypothetical protein
MESDDACFEMGRRDGAKIPDLTRREVLVAGATALASLAWVSPAFAADEGFRVSEATRAALGESSLLYVSPLHKNGSESSCHGEVWYFVDGNAVVIATAADRWKVRAIRSGRDRARVWVGDHGPVWRAGKRYRDAPSFLARAEIDDDKAVFERLMQAFAERYADEWSKWKPRFDKGYADGSRLVVRYTPIEE